MPLLPLWGYSVRGMYVSVSVFNDMNDTRLANALLKGDDVKRSCDLSSLMPVHCNVPSRPTPSFMLPLS
jgi:hypothetical protein